MIRQEFRVGAPADLVWDAFRDVGAVHTRLARGFVTDCTLSAGVRTVTFANGMTVDERIVSIDDDIRRLAYSATGGRASHHHAVVEVFDDVEGARVSWTTDVLPDDAAPAIRAMVEAGTTAMVSTLGSRAGGETA